MTATHLLESRADNAPTERFYNDLHTISLAGEPDQTKEAADERLMRMFDRSVDYLSDVLTDDLSTVQSGRRIREVNEYWNALRESTLQEGRSFYALNAFAALLDATVDYIEVQDKQANGGSL